MLIMQIIRFLFTSFIISMAILEVHLSYSGSNIEILEASCPSELSNGERGDVNYIIHSTNPMKLNIINSNISIDQYIKSNQSMSAFIPTENIKYPATLNPKSIL